MNEFWAHLSEMASDPAHLVFEVLSTVVIEGVFLALLWPLARRSMTKIADRRSLAEHAVIDAEHGIVNHGMKPGRHKAGAAT